MYILSGTSLFSEHLLLDTPVALCCYHMDEASTHIPVVAVASGSHIFIYRNLRPYYKFTLPPLPVDSREIEIWQEMKEGKITPAKGYELLGEAKERGSRLTSRSLDYLSLDVDMENMELQMQQRGEYVDKHKHAPLVQQVLSLWIDISINEIIDSG